MLDDETCFLFVKHEKKSFYLPRIQQGKDAKVSILKMSHRLELVLLNMYFCLKRLTWVPLHTSH